MIWVSYGPGSFGTWDSITGDVFAMWRSRPDTLSLPDGYISGDILSANAIKFNTDIETLGMTPGIYVNTFSNGNFSDTLTINIGTTVPEANSIVFLGLVGLASIRRRRSVN